MHTASPATPALTHFVFVIGSTDDFESVNDLHIAAEARALGGIVDLNFSCHPFSVPSALDEDTINLIGRGLAFYVAFCMAAILDQIHAAGL